MLLQCSCPQICCARYPNQRFHTSHCTSAEPMEISRPAAHRPVWHCHTAGPGSPAVVDILQKSAQKLWPWRPWKGCLNVETHFQMIGLTELSSTFSEIFYVEICRATISTMMSFPLSPKLSKASSPLMSLSSLQGKLQGPSFLWLGMVNAQGDAHRFDSCETQLSLAYLSIMCPSLYSDEPPGFSWHDVFLSSWCHLAWFLTSCATLLDGILEVADVTWDR